MNKEEKDDQLNDAISRRIINSFNEQKSRKTDQTMHNLSSGILQELNREESSPLIHASPKYPKASQLNEINLFELQVENEQSITQNYFYRTWSDIAKSGLTIRQRILSLPVFGYLIAWCVAFIKLPLTRHQYANDIARLCDQNKLLKDHLQNLQRSNQVNCQGINQRIDQVEPFIEQNRLNILELFTKLELKISIQDKRLQTQESSKLIARLHSYDMMDVGVRLMKLEQIEASRKIKNLTELIRLAELDKTSQQNKESALPNQDVNKEKISTFDKDAFYLDFEEKFRGSKEEIKQRLQVYLPYLSVVIAKPKEARQKFVDVGCGRGEWLALMEDHEIPVIGVDLNVAMVDACIADGYVAKTADAIVYLNSLEENSLGGVTGFHIIEHLPFDHMIALFDAALRALSKGGVLIFETPNPENLIIGACNFYYDPTHLHPIVPDVASFIATQRGFAEVEILRLHPFPSDYQMHGDTQIDETLNKFLFSAQDYALIARK